MNSIILSTYLTQKPDPQAPLCPDRPKYWAKDDDNVVRGWIESVKRLHLNGMIFHDSLSEAFCERWGGDGVSLRNVVWNAAWNATEHRFAIYHFYLTVAKYEYVLLTDLSDVSIHADPFPLMTDPNAIYIGSEPWCIAGTCVETWMRDAYGEVGRCRGCHGTECVDAGARAYSHRRQGHIVWLIAVVRGIMVHGLACIGKPGYAGYVPDACKVGAYGFRPGNERIQDVRAFASSRHM